MGRRGCWREGGIREGDRAIKVGRGGKSLWEEGVEVLTSKERWGEKEEGIT